MTRADFVWVMAGVLLNAIAQLLLKAAAAGVGPLSMAAGTTTLWRAAADLLQHPALLGGLLCYAVSVMAWIVALSRLDVSVAYPMLSLGYVINAWLAGWLFGEEVSLQRWIGIGVIVIGVALVARSGSTS